MKPLSPPPRRWLPAAACALLGLASAASSACSGDDGKPGGGFIGAGTGGTAATGGAGDGSGGIGQGGGAGEGQGGTGGGVVVGTECDGASCAELGPNFACYEEADVAMCRCKPGFAGEECQDINECAGPEACHAQAACENYPGGFSCTCDPGYVGNGQTCSDVNECVAGLNTCASGATCSNVSGGYTCECPGGQFGDGFFCKAENDCDPDPCVAGVCINTPAGFKCECPLSTFGPTCEETETCEFADALVEEAVRLSIGVPEGDITPDDLAGVTTLYLPEDDGMGRVVESLEGLECWTTLERLYVGDNDVSDLSPLSDLHRLQVLDLGCNPLGDAALADLANLTALEELYLDHPVFCEETEKLTTTALAALTDLVGLRALYLGGHELQNLNALASLSRLEVVEATSNQITNVSGLSALVNLRTVLLGDNAVSDLSPLAGLPGLRELTLDDNGISDVAPLGGATSLRRLSLRGNALTDVSALSTLTSLTLLDLSGNGLTSGAGVAGLSGLTDLRLSNNSVSSLQPFVDNPSYGQGGQLWIVQNPLPCATQQPLIQELAARGLSIIGSCTE